MPKRVPRRCGNRALRILDTGDLTPERKVSYTRCSNLGSDAMWVISVDGRSVRRYHPDGITTPKWGRVAPLQLETAARRDPGLAPYLILAWRLRFVTHFGREESP